MSLVLCPDLLFLFGRRFSRSVFGKLGAMSVRLRCPDPADQLLDQSTAAGETALGEWAFTPLV